ncbi:MAG TPA: universal stress protein [Acidimicrobiales bacterium]
MELPFDEILVPLDGSRLAERALAPALELVERIGVPLRLVSRALPGEEEELASYLAGLADRHADVTDVETSVEERDAIPSAIAANVGGGTLVCMSTHGHSGPVRVLIGSVASALLRAIDVPALVVGPKVPDPATIGDGRIVACLDGSHLAERTVEPAHRWSRALGLPLWLVQVVPPGLEVEERTHGDVSEGAYLAGLAASVGEVTGWDVLHDTDPADAIVAMDGRDPVAVLVLATRGRSGWSRLALGSVTSTVMREATVPVLVVPAGREPDTASL